MDRRLRELLLDKDRKALELTRQIRRNKKTNESADERPRKNAEEAHQCNLEDSHFHLEYLCADVKRQHRACQLEKSTAGNHKKHGNDKSKHTFKHQ